MQNKATLAIYMFLDSKETHSVKKESQCYKEILASANDCTWLYAVELFSVVRLMNDHSDPLLTVRKGYFFLEH